MTTSVMTRSTSAVVSSANAACGLCTAVTVWPSGRSSRQINLDGGAVAQLSMRADKSTGRADDAVDAGHDTAAGPYLGGESGVDALLLPGKQLAEHFRVIGVGMVHAQVAARAPSRPTRSPMSRPYRRSGG